MIAVDTNILVYAHREESPWHGAARAKLAHLAEGSAAWAIPWPCVHEFLAIVTHARIWRPPTPMPTAVAVIQGLFASPGLVLLAEVEGYWGTLRRLLEGARTQGPSVHDARIAALCLTHGVRELWSADRDFGRFPELPVRNPLLKEP